MRKPLALAAALAVSLTTSLGFASTTNEEGYILVEDGVRLFYRISGLGTDTVVVLHGGPGGQIASICPDVVQLLAHHRVLFYDQRGGGQSGLPQDAGQLRMTDHVNDLEAVRRHFKLERVKLIGHEWGGALATQYAVAHPERVERLLLIAPVPARAAQWQAFRSAVDARLASDLARRDDLLVALRGEDPEPACRALHKLTAETLFADRNRAVLQRGSSCSARPDVQRYAAANTVPAAWLSLGDWDWRGALGAVRAPTLIVHGERDLMSADAMQELAAAFADARVLVIPGAGHFPHIEAADLFWAAADQFMAGAWPAGARTFPRAVAGS